MTHELKILPEWYETLASGVKTFEVRKDDREPKFSPGDTLFLREFDGTKYTGRSMTADVGLVLRGEYCREGYCIMSVSVKHALCYMVKAESASPWIDIREEQPKDECIAISMLKGHPSYNEMLVGCIYSNPKSTTGFIAESKGEYLDCVTHWMPKPKEPGAWL